MSESNFKLWRLVGRANHSILVLRQRELRQHGVAFSQLYLLGRIKDLGTDATLNELAKQVERQPNVISKQTVCMENDGLIKRIKNKPKSNLLKLELTQKGLELIEIARQSESIDAIFSSLSKDERQQMESILNKILIKTQKYKSVKYREPTGF
jgi:DNA-binding MarR family transcriptional regulator